MRESEGSAAGGLSRARDAPRGERLETWSEIAAHLGIEVRTAQRWEKREGLPVHRHLHDKQATVHAYTGEIERWRKERTQAPADDRDSRTPAAAWRRLANGSAETDGAPLTLGHLSRALSLVVLGFVLGLAVASAPDMVAGGSPAEVAPKRFSMELPPDAPLLSGGSGAPLDVSRDGRRVVYVGGHIEDYALYATRLGEGIWRRLPDTSGAWSPVFSPDGEWIAYLTGASGEDEWDTNVEIRRVPFDGGEPVVVTAPDDHYPGYLTWGTDGWIYFAMTRSIWRIRPTGGEPVLLAEPEPGSEMSYRWARPLPDGRRILFQARPDNLSLDGHEVRMQRIDPGAGRPRGPSEVLLEGTKFFRAIPSGHLLTYHTRVLWAWPFDPDGPEVGNSAAPVLTSWNDFAVSDTGTLVHFAFDGDEYSPIMWRARDGSESEAWRPEASVRCDGHVDLSPDGRRVALSCHDRGDPSSRDVWIADVDSGSRQRLNRPGQQWSPVWSPDGRRIAVSSERDGLWRLLSLDPDRPEQDPRILAKSPRPNYPQSFSPDGRLLVHLHVDPEGGRDQPPPGCGTCFGDADLWALPVDGSGPPRPVVATAAYEARGAISPDGRWLAYHANAGEDWHVYVTPFPEGGSGTRVSSHPGGWPTWSADGSELFYVTSPKQAMVRVPIAGGRTLRQGRPRVLFRSRPHCCFFHNRTHFRMFDLSPDGRSFIGRRGSRQDVPTASRLQVVRDWFEELDRALPEP